MSFKDLLNKPAESFEAPKALPVGTYVFLVKEHKLGESKQKKTPVISYSLIPMSAEADVEPELLTAYGPLQKRAFNLDFYLTEDAVYRLTEFHSKLGHNIKLPLSELIPQATNKMVRGVISHTMSQDGKNTYANISDIIGIAE